MPDSQVPPSWGPAYDERDLDALLSGQPRTTPVALQPVESTLAALRATATRRELSSEAAARAAFRAFAPGSAPRVPATLPQAALTLPPAPAPWAAPAEHPAVTARTLVLRPADERQRPAARHRRRRPAASGARRPSKAVTGAAAAALIVVAAAVTGALTGSIGDLTSSFGRQPASASASARETGQSSGSQRVLGSAASSSPMSHSAASATASARATAPGSPRPTSGPESLCREYFGYFEHQGRGDGAALIAVEEELSQLAGGRFKVFGYCFRVLDQPGDKALLPPIGPDPGGHGTKEPDNPLAGNPGTGDQGNQGTGNGGQGPSGLPGAGASRSNDGP